MSVLETITIDGETHKLPSGNVHTGEPTGIVPLRIDADSCNGVILAIDGEGNRGYLKADGSFSPFSSGGSGSKGYDVDISINKMIDITTDERFTISDNGYPWSYQNRLKFAGINAYTSFNIDNSSETIETIVFRPIAKCVLRIYYTCCAEGNAYDYLTLTYDDEIIVSKWNDTQDVTEYKWYYVDKIVEEGQEHTIIAKYVKDGSSIQGADAAGLVFLELGGI